MTEPTARPADPPELMTPEELSSYLQIPVPTITRWRNEHFGPPYSKVGRRVRYSRVKVDAWVEAQEVGQAAAGR